MKTQRNSRKNPAAFVRISRINRSSPGSDLAVDSVTEAFLLAKALYGTASGHVVFTKRAEEAAFRSPFVRPREVFAYLDKLAIFAGRLAENNGALGMSFAAYFSSVGLVGYRPHVSQTAEGLYKQEYMVVHEGRTYRCDHHFTLGAKNANNCLSIHFDVDRRAKKVVITHCGRHLHNTQS